MSYFDEDEMDDIAEGEVKVQADGVTATVNIPDRALEAITNGIAYRLEQAISRRVEKQIQDKVADLVAEAVVKVIGDRAEGIVREILDRPRQKTDSWGNPTGPAVAFADLIPGIVDSYLNAKVNDKGQVDTYRSDSNKTRAAWIIATHVREHIEPVTTQAVANITKQARDVVSQKIAAFVSEQMVPSIEARRS